MDLGSISGRWGMSALDMSGYVHSSIGNTVLV